MSRNVGLGLEKWAPVSLWSLRAAWVQIPLPAPETKVQFKPSPQDRHKIPVRELLTLSMKVNPSGERREGTRHDDAGFGGA